MGKGNKIFGIIFNILSFICIFASAIPNNTTDNDVNGINAAFALWVYSVIFALIASLLYSIGAFKAFKSNGNVFRLLFTVAVFALCISIGGNLDSTSIIIWNVISAVNLILQIKWLIKD